MVGLTELWLPVLVSGVLVFVASSIMHMVLPLHRKDYAKLAGEDDVLAAMRKAGVQPGNYMFPHCSAKEMGSEEHTQKCIKGPVGFANIYPNGPPAMGKSLVQWFLFTLVVGVFVAYIVGQTHPAGTDYMRIFRIAGSVAFMVYVVAAPVESIWKGQKWSTSIKFCIDGVVYSLVTAGAFGWLWPQ